MASVTKYTDCDFWIHRNDVQRLGFDKNLNYEEMIELAVKYRCPIIVKNGKGKWYLKGNRRTKDEIQEQIEKHLGKKRRRTLYFVDLFS
jgi:hypothetical protein